MKHVRSFSILNSVDSTNNYAMGKVHAGMAKHGQAWFANDQTAGKGQRGRTWASTPGENIILTVVIQPDALLTTKTFPFNAYIALTCLDFLQKTAGDHFSIKWPNDLYWCDRKAGGILIENVIQGTEWKWSVVGIGINVNQLTFPESVTNAVS
jgi:BirA family biotin operon repressor/biotin-[acetyl-CoA-carboxylase] ligase